MILNCRNPPDKPVETRPSAPDLGHKSRTFVPLRLFYLPNCLQNFVRQTIKGNQNRTHEGDNPLPYIGIKSIPRLFLLFVRMPNFNFQFAIKQSTRIWIKGH